MKNYLILSNDIVTINNYIDYILKENNLCKENIIKYDLSLSPLDNVIEDLNTYGFLTNNKVVICEKPETIFDDKRLEEYLLNPNLDNILVLICDNLDNRKKIAKLIKEKCIILEKSINIQDLIKNRLEDYNMNLVAINYLINICSNDNEKILNELNKLMLYKYNDKSITIEDIDKVVVRSLEDNVFDLINCIIKKDIYKAINIYHKLLEKGEDTIKLVILVADQFRLIYSSKILMDEGKNRFDISKMLNIHEYRIKLACEASYNFKEKELLNILNELGKIEIKSKISKISNRLEFERFLYNIGGNYAKD